MQYPIYLIQDKELLDEQDKFNSHLDSSDFSPYLVQHNKTNISCTLDTAQLCVPSIATYAIQTHVPDNFSDMSFQEHASQDF